MNLRELFEPNLTELNMSPTNLRSLAAKTRATVGIEFEMILKGYRQTDNGADQSVSSFYDIEDFFGQNNTLRTVNRVIDRLEQKYNKWVQDEAQDDFDSVQGERWFVNWLEENVNEKTVAEEMDVDREDVNYWDFMEYCQKESFGNYWYQTAFDEYVEEQVRYNQKLSQENFLKDQGLTTIGAVYDEFQYDLEMPTGITQETYGEVAGVVERVLGKEADWSDTYHGVDRDEGRYIVEPDSSITPESESYDLPVEIVGPPQSVTEALADYRKLRSWALVNKHYTNHSTGLHINVSLPNYNADVDWTKLVLLSGDEYVLEQFGRLNNHYAANALELIRQRIEQNKSDQSRRATPEIKDAVVNLVASKLDQLAEMIASKLMSRGHISVVVKANRIEFRSPGGDWLKYEPEVIENTVYRYVVALDAAMDPAKYREDYLKKMYQLVGGGKQSDLMMGVFKYHRGFMTKAEFQKMLQSYYKTGLPKPAQPGTPGQPPVITELFERPLTYSPILHDDYWGKLVSWFYVENMIYVFIAEDADLWNVEFRMIRPRFTPEEKDLIEKDPYGKDVWNLIKDQVRVLGSTKMEDTGHAAKVMGTVIAIFDKFMQSKMPKKVKFTAKTSDRGRVNLYRRLAKLAGTKYTYRVDEYHLGSAIDWELVQTSE